MDTVTTNDKIGLTAAEAAERLVKFGPNELPGDEKPSLITTGREILAEPMLLLLLAAAAFYLAVGDLAEGLLLAFFAILTIGLGVYQRRRSENRWPHFASSALPSHV